MAVAVPPSLPLDGLVLELATHDQLVHLRRLPSRAERTAELTTPLADHLRASLPIARLWTHQAEAIDLARAGRSIVVATGTASGKSLCYQVPIAEAIDRGRQTAEPATALCLFPTKALAHDQLRSFVELAVPGIKPVAYDGDSAPAERTWARQKANVVLTNPEMLHGALLPNHVRWGTFLSRLRYVVVDELHVFRGIFGTHVSHIIRRLRRLCANYGSDPVFISCSATIGQPGRLASELTGVPAVEVTDDGSPRGERLVALWNPPLLERFDAFGDDLGCDVTAGDGGVYGVDGEPIELGADVGVELGAEVGIGTEVGVDESLAADPGEPSAGSRASGRFGGARVSAHRETAMVVAELVQAGRRTIAFCRSRRGTELVAADVRQRLPVQLADRVQPYRAGYLPEERREIEAALFTGQLQAVIATTALELGVDIGGLDACVLDGFPGTIASMRQQMGRAGREHQESLAVLIAGRDQLDQWLIAHPDEIFDREPEPAVINPANPNVLHPHLAAAAYELALTPYDERYWPDLLDDGVRVLVQADQLFVRRNHRRSRARAEAVVDGGAVAGDAGDVGDAGGGRAGDDAGAGSLGGGPRSDDDDGSLTVRPVAAVWAGRGSPARGIGLRSGGSAEEFQIVSAEGDLIGTIDQGRAFDSVHAGAIYLHQGQTFRVATLDLDDRRAVVEHYDGDEYTLARTDVTIAIQGIEREREVGRTRLALGTVLVSSQVTGYQRKEVGSGASLGVEPLDLPATRLVTRAFWYVVDDEELNRAGVGDDGAPGTLHAVEHAAIGMMPLFTICDRWDVGGVSTTRQADTGKPTIVIYDGYAGGTGIAELGYDVADRHLAATYEVIAGCPCAAGCPSCVQSPKCGNGNSPLDKAGAIALLGWVLS